MPQQRWRFGPCCSRGTTLSQYATCIHCRSIGTFEGWHLSMHESMARYQYVYGLKPNGPHRPLADGLLTPLRTVCIRCDGRGVMTGKIREEWRACRVCEGTGGMWTVSDATARATCRTVLQAFPDAAAPEAPANFLGGLLALDVNHNCMIDARSARPTTESPVVPPLPAPLPPPRLTPSTAAADRSWPRWPWVGAFLVIRALIVASAR